MSECEHLYLYGGVKYRVIDEDNDPHWGRLIRYFDFYYCQKCLDLIYAILPITSRGRNERLFNASPIPEERENDKS